MAGQYSEDAGRDPALVLAIDTSSPTASIALGRSGRVLEQRLLEQRDTSRNLLSHIDTLLDQLAATIQQVGALIGIRGPGSFTGLRVGLATLQGLHQSLGVPAMALSSLEVLSRQAEISDSPVVAAVDALRGQWYAQIFSGDRERRALAPPAILEPAAIAEWTPGQVVGFGLDPLRQALKSLAPTDGDRQPPRFPSAQPLAPGLIVLAEELDIWDATTLARPLYLRAAAAHKP